MVQTVQGCVSCANLQPSFFCSVNKKEVELYNTCESHEMEIKITTGSNCGNCSKFNTGACAHPQMAAPKLLCFSWQG